MKKIVALFSVLIFILCSVLPVYAQDGKVTYSGNSGKFIFEPGSEYSPTDLFPEFKSVMPGDTISQKITVKNKASNKIKVKIYLRSLGAHEDSVEFLSQLGLKVATSKDNNMAYMFDAAANETAQLSDWVCLGTLYSGGEVNLDVTLSVPTELDNKFQNNIGSLDWEFRIEELPLEPGDPKPPKTGDDSHLWLWVALMFSSLIMLSVLFVLYKKRKEKE